jgi:hypothetical protein
MTSFVYTTYPHIYINVAQAFLERSSEDILSSCFRTLYLWTIAFVSPLSIALMIFLYTFPFSLGDPYCILSVYFETPYIFNKISYYL